MHVFRLAIPVDEFDGLVPLPEWLGGASVREAAWALQAVLALADAASEVGWRGDMRHLPSVGVALTPPGVTPYLVVKQDDNGATFVVTAVAAPWIADYAVVQARTVARHIGAWSHPRGDEIADLVAEVDREASARDLAAGPAF